MIAIHIIAMVSTTIAAFIKSILLFINKNTFQKVHSATTKYIRILMIVGVGAGIYIIVTKFGGIVPIWLIIKLALFVVGGITVGQAEKRENKIMMLIGSLILLLVIVQANVKLS
ncbi:MAG: hypothetical protein WDO15_24480 [Bacteroidota bacterium]